MKKTVSAMLLLCFLVSVFSTAYATITTSYDKLSDTLKSLGIEKNNSFIIGAETKNCVYFSHADGKVYWFMEGNIKKYVAEVYRNQMPYNPDYIMLLYADGSADVYDHGVWKHKTSSSTSYSISSCPTWFTAFDSSRYTLNEYIQKHR